MPDNDKEKAVAFICGDLFSMGFIFLKMPDEMMHIGLKIATTLMVGLVGGLAGVAGKDLYAFIKPRIIKLFKKKK